MLDKLRNLAGKAMDAAKNAATSVGDLNGDGKVDEEDYRIAADWAKKTAGSVGDEAGRLGKEVARSQMAKDAATGAAIGAAVAIPIPIIGPIAGATIGAGIGVYKNLSRTEAKVLPAGNSMRPDIDLHSEITKLADLREKSLITDAEFNAAKIRLLNRDALPANQPELQQPASRSAAIRLLATLS